MRKFDYETSLTQAQLVITVVHGDQPFTLLLMDRDSTTNVVKTVINRHGTFADLRPILCEYASAGWEPYMLVGITDGSGHSRDSVVGSWAVAADFDTGFPDMLASNELIQPTILISTSPERYHAVWLLDAACSREDMHFLSCCIQDRLGSDPAFARSNQAIRLPGFLNRKNNHRVRIASQKDHTGYSRDFLLDAFDCRLVAATLKMHNFRYDDKLIIPKTVPTDQVVNDAKEALKFVASLAANYSDWIKIGLSLAGLGEDGRELFHSFSKQSNKYNAHECDKKWNDLVKRGDSDSIRTLFSTAQRLGWSNPGFRKNARSYQAMTEREFGALCAEEMSETYAVLNSLPSKGDIVFLKLEGSRYIHLSDIEKRSHVEKFARQVLSKLFADTENAGSKSSWIRKIGTNKGLNELSEHIAEVLLMAHEGHKVISYPYFAVENGVLNLLSLELVPCRYMPLPLWSAPVSYDRNATAPLFMQVLRDIFEEDEEMIRFVHRLFGIILLGKPVQHFFVWLGPTASNGKSLLVTTLKGILGKYFSFLPTAALMVKSHTTDGANPAIAQLSHKRLAVISEPTAKQTLDASLIKQLTGDRHINVRAIYGTPQDMAVEATFLMVANYMPAARDDDNGLWRRTVVIPFNRTFGPDEADPHLSEKLADEYSGILNWMLQGAHDYLKHGLHVPKKVELSIKKQRNDTDPYLLFAADCLLSSPNSASFLRDIHAAYVEWSKRNLNLRRLTKIELSKRLEMHYSKRISGNLPVFDGVDVQGN